MHTCTVLGQAPSLSSCCTFVFDQYTNIITEDERSIANKLEREEKRENEDEKLSEEDRARKIDATLPAKLHGNEPSKGAKLDQELREEEQAELERKGKA